MRAAVLDVRVERHVAAAPRRCRPRPSSRNASRVRRPRACVASSSSVLAVDLGDLLDAVLVAQQVLDLLVEDLPGELARLLEDHAAVLGVGVVAEVGALVDEALAVGVDHDAERIGVLLEAGRRRRGRRTPARCAPSRPRGSPTSCRRARADLQRHADAVAGVEARAAHLGQIPARAEIARAPFGVGLEAAGGEHHGLGADLARSCPSCAHAHALRRRRRRDRATTRARRSGSRCRRFVADLVQRLDEARAAADRLRPSGRPRT